MEAAGATPWLRRCGWAALSLLLTGVLLVARVLTPDPSGVGTHLQLGLPPCGLMSWLGFRCPACGLTTSFAHMARLAFLPALRAHPLGPLLFGLFAWGSALSATACARGHTLQQVIDRHRLDRIALWLALGLVLVWLLRL